MLSFRFAPLAAALVASVAAGPLQRRGTNGRASFFHAGAGACGWTNSGSDKIVAVTQADWDNGANCGRTIFINHKGNTQQATVADLCPTCTGSHDLDMSWSLFSALGGTAEQGVFQMNWQWESSGSSSSSTNDDSNNSGKSSSSSSSSSSSHKSTSILSSSSSTSSHSVPKQTQASTSHSVSATRTVSTSAQAQATGSSPSEANETVTGEPAWWAEVIDYCGLDTEPQYPVAIAESKLYRTDDLSKACGKAVSVRNPANNKIVEATIVSYLPGAEENYIAMGDAFRVLSDDYENPEVDSVEWGFPISS